MFGATIDEGTDEISFKVKIVEELVRIDFPEIQVASRELETKLPDGSYTNNESHPFEGDYLTLESYNKLGRIIASYKKQLDIDNLAFVRLETEGASLSWGGLYDINKAWHGSHKEHRLGNNIDLSMSIFNKEESVHAKDYLKNAIIINLRGYPFADCEGPDPERNIDCSRTTEQSYQPNHWHVRFK